MIKAHLSPWVYAWIVLDVVLVCAITALIVLMVRRSRDEKLHPNKYKRKIKE
ncbi:MAG: hypothetical protein K6E79_08405 [Pseudobutyrivibrio sp.]|nr:hypothetical protein [Pseudobutyrivibrio sp.]